VRKSRACAQLVCEREVEGLVVWSMYSDVLSRSIAALSCASTPARDGNNLYANIIHIRAIPVRLGGVPEG
jgi:hypothetical protein